ncbi:50S ribosomal protein L22 [Candidatus Similichlamydia laticola]|uniref:Large ribosomal subunit protein uL22 n=1 Tax=Candidatus Similichlamydia laticola TaxID=2170265 RepID=A0A369KHW3_9BACT|nr:50S ribosomal protein L22 [Candidatus Similichlamydia laticola]RDB31383.1 LSU ribosomal protein L22p (L17e) [Candidatus Similichlamydia laticola]
MNGQQSEQKSARALSKYVRISPRKARLVVGMIRGVRVPEAVFRLSQSGTKSGRLLMLTLMSAVSNAESKFLVPRQDLVVLRATVDEGPRLKRARGRSRGGKTPILKRMSHLTVVVGCASSLQEGI